MSDPKSVHEAIGESVVDEVREIRTLIDEEAGHDLRELAELLNRRGEEVCREYGMRTATPTR